jgi:di/tricarboxylate transporter
MEDYIGEAKLPSTSALAGKTVSDLETLADHDVAVDAIVRQGDRRYIPAAHWRLYADDLLVLRGDPEDLHKLVENAKLELVGKKDLPRDKTEDRETPEIVTIEAVITTNSLLIGRTPGQVRLRERYGVNLLAARSGSRRPRIRLKHLLFKEGDLVVLQGPAESINDTLNSLGCLPLAERHLQLGRRRHVALPLLILVASVAVSATEAVPAAIAFTAGAVLIGLLRILSLQEIYDSIDWPILILIGALIPVGEAMHANGTTDLVAHWLTAVAVHLPAAVSLGLVLAITMLVTPLLHHAAAVIVMGPVAASLAHQLGLNVDPFLMAVAVGAGSDFLSPIGHQCNTLVMGPGGYRFSDYWHLGLPLSALVVLCGVPVILLAWPLH